MAVARAPDLSQGRRKPRESVFVDAAAVGHAAASVLAPARVIPRRMRDGDHRRVESPLTGKRSPRRKDLFAGQILAEKNASACAAAMSTIENAPCMLSSR